MSDIEPVTHLMRPDGHSATSGGGIAATEARIATLDGYRALAILAVLAYHYTVRWAPPHDPNAHLPAGAIFNGFVPFEYGWLGVEFFFVISGFVIAMTLARCRSIADFAVRRFARLWPPLFVAASLTAVVMAMIGPADWQASLYNYLASVLMIGPDVLSAVLRHKGIGWVDGVYWSLWVEVRFYAIAGVAYFLARGNFISVWLVLQIVVMLAALAVHIAHLPLGSALLEQLFLVSYLPYFTLGICACEIYRDGPKKILAIAGALCAAAGLLLETGLAVGIYQGKPVLGSELGNIGILAMLFLFLVNHPLTGIFQTRAVVRLGQASYSLYLIHQLIGVSVMRKALEFGLPYLLVLPLTIALMVTLAFILYRLVEVPAKKWILQHTAGATLALEQSLPWLRYRQSGPTVPR